MRKHSNIRAQASIEMIFAVILTTMMIYSILKVTLWAGREMIKVQTDHDDTLSQPANMNFSSLGEGPMGQIDSGAFHQQEKLHAAWLGL